MIGSSTGHFADAAPLIPPAFAAALLSAIAVGCTPGATPLGAPAVYVSHLPPTKADIIEALVQSSDIPVSVHWSCPSTGGDDSTIGRYVSNRLSSLERDATNWVEVRTVSRRAPTGMYWKSTVIFHSALDREWLSSYGVEFLVRQRDGAVIPSSFTCPGH